MKKSILSMLAAATMLAACTKEEQPILTPDYAPRNFKLEVTETITNPKTQAVTTHVKRTDSAATGNITIRFAPNVKVTIKIIPYEAGFEGVHFFANNYVQLCDVQKVSDLEYILTPAENYKERLTHIEDQKPVYGQAWNGGLPSYNNVCSATFYFNPQPDDIEE